MKNYKKVYQRLVILVFLVVNFFFNFAGGGVVVQKVYGYVKVANTQTAIYQAKVELKQNGAVVGSTSTRTDGYYLISSPYKGNFDVYASKQGYLLQNKTVFVDTGKSVKVDFFLSPQIDTTPPSLPVITDSGAFTNSTTELFASWSSWDAESGISEYQYSIGRKAGDIDVLGWTTAGLKTSLTVTGLSLIGGQTYYFNVKAKNSVGLWSAIGSSDGITVNRAPAISSFKPNAGTTFEQGDIIALSVQASDLDLDPLEYQFSINNVVTRPWSLSSGYSWTISSGDTGIKNIKAEVRDNKGAVSQASSEIYVFRKPVQL